VIPKPEVVIEDAPTPTTSFERLEPSRARERRNYEATEDDNTRFRAVAEALLDSLDVEYTVDYTHGDFQRAAIEVGDGAAGLLIGKQGSGIDALETLLSRMTSHQCAHAVPVQADVNGYRKRHEEELHETALVRAQRALETGEDEEFRPLHARDRRIVHLAVKTLGPELTTYSVGHGGEKAVVIRRTDPDSAEE
jgi:spoIIIJ-associated protein